MSKNQLMTVQTLAPPDAKGLVPFEAGKQANGGLDGASALNRDTALWSARSQPVDVEVDRSKTRGDARAIEQANNNGYVSGAVETYKDSVIGDYFQLNASPDWKYLGLDSVWASEWKAFVESHWNLYAEGQDCLAHAAGRLTVTEILRILVGTYVLSGDGIISSEWLTGNEYRGRPYKTAFNLIEPSRLCNPQDVADNQFLRRGIEVNRFGREMAFHFRSSLPSSPYAEARSYEWKRVAATKPWGRKLILHYADIKRPEQTRAISRLLASIKEVRMLDKYSDVVLQNAIVNATYAATIESELPRDIVFAQLGEMGSSSSGSPLGAGPLVDYMTMFLNAANQYQGGSKNLALDGVKIPHLLPGTKLNLQNAGNPGGVGTNFESSFQRHFARSIGMSYEEFSGNFADTNYSAARASMAVTDRTMRTVKRFLAARAASDMLTNFIEEVLNSEGSNAPMPRNAPNFYERMNKQAYTKARWIGSPRAQIDEMKETQAAILRMSAGISSREDESARLGKDWREVSRQRALERDLDDELGLGAPSASTAKNTGKASSQRNQKN